MHNFRISLQWQAWVPNAGVRTTSAPLLVLALLGLPPNLSAVTCLPRITPPSEPPEYATAYNGLALPDVCFDGSHDMRWDPLRGVRSNPGYTSSEVPDSVLHFFTISDWGGIPYGGGPPVPANTIPRDIPKHSPDGSYRVFVKGVDDQAQQLVAAQMAKRATTSQPKFVLNAGDMFYWHGVEAHCGSGMRTVKDPKKQFSKVFEAIYTGEALKNVPWLGALGNHDYGGRTYTSGWDQIIAYTWGAGGRWVTPALYFRQRVHHSDFTADFFMVDTNVCDADGPVYSNICGGSGSCGEHAPNSAEECVTWFRTLWSDQLKWLEQELYESTAMADWQVVVTHFPPEGAWQLETWRRLCELYGIDLLVTGHRHQQEVHAAGTTDLGDTAYVVSGGGGGITSGATPDAHGLDDQYGFMDISMSKSKLKIEAISHSGVVRSTTLVEPRIASRTATSTTTVTMTSTTTLTSTTTTVTMTSTTTSTFTLTNTSTRTTSSATLSTTFTSTVSATSTCEAATTHWNYQPRQNQTGISFAGTASCYSGLVALVLVHALL